VVEEVWIAQDANAKRVPAGRVWPVERWSGEVTIRIIETLVHKLVSDLDAREKGWG